MCSLVCLNGARQVHCVLSWRIGMRVDISNGTISTFRSLTFENDASNLSVISPTIAIGIPAKRWQIRARLRLCLERRTGKSYVGFP